MNYLWTEEPTVLKDPQASWADSANGVKAWLSLGLLNGVLPGVVTRTFTPLDSLYHVAGLSPASASVNSRSSYGTLVFMLAELQKIDK